jgi:4-alpha-glucanotransferase
VVRSGTAPWFWVHVPDGADVEVWVELEDGAVRTDVVQQDHWVPPAVVDGAAVGEATFAVPSDLPLGWHVLHARSGELRAITPLVVTPAVLGLPPALRDRRDWGFATQLYSLRSTRSWGIGDLADLGDLAAWSGHELGADFVLVNPLHAAAPIAPMEPSPYLPVSRRFGNPLYLRVEAVPEFGYLDPDDRVTVAELATPVRAANTSAARLDRDGSWTAKRLALELVHRVPRSPGREVAYRAFLEREGQGLLDFATWSVLVEEQGVDWTAWPAELHDPHGPAAAEVRHRLADRVDFHCWLQWLLDEQLEAAQRAARAAGMRSGIVHDLAVGVHPHGADAWALQDALAEGITVGAPADAFNQQGQDWSQPPWRPDRLAELAYRPYRDMLRTVLRHAGGLRVDHVLGLFRLWWVPAGLPQSARSYFVYYHVPSVGILSVLPPGAGAFVGGEGVGSEMCIRDRDQSWPCWLNASAGAPTVMPSARTSCSAHASAPWGLSLIHI